MNAEPQPPPEPAHGPGPGRSAARRPVITRAGMAWTATIAALVLLILLIAFIVQNQDNARIRFFGLDGTISLGIALLIAAVGGGGLVAVAGAVRIIQLRSRNRRTPQPGPDTNAPGTRSAQTAQSTAPASKKAKDPARPWPSEVPGA